MDITPTLLLLLLPLIFVLSCDINGTWSTWQLIPEGYDYCGAGWKPTFTRRCLSEPGCPCTGNTTFAIEMFTQSCSPEIPCFPGYTLNSTTKFCGPVHSPPVDWPPDIPASKYCPPSGVGIWSSWSEWSPCSADCGQFGIMNRTRRCISEDYGCPCFKSDAGPCQTMSCPGHLCPTGPPCAGATALSYNGNHTVCYPKGVVPSNGTWSAWSNLTSCSDDCGMHGVGPSRRYCLPSGSICQGPFVRFTPCPTDPCIIIANSTRDPCNKTVSALDEVNNICILTLDLPRYV